MNPDRKNVLVIAEAPRGVVGELTYELLGIARRIAQASGGTVAAAMLGEPQASDVARLGAHGADRIFAISDDAANAYLAERWLAALPSLMSEHGCAHVLMGHTDLGAELGPRLAFRLDGIVATGCEQVDYDNGEIRILRACFGNKAREGVTLRKSPAVVTVRSRTNDPLPPGEGKAEVISVPGPKDFVPATAILGREQETEAQGARLETAKVVVAGGRGLGGPEGFRLLEELASAVGGTVGASRVACDLGWVPRSRQIGLSGRTVSPDLYVAIGISGASHHLAGCGSAKAILAINSDPEADIFKVAAFGVVGDYKEVVPALIAAIESR